MIKYSENMTDAEIQMMLYQIEEEDRAYFIAQSYDNDQFCDCDDYEVE